MLIDQMYLSVCTTLLLASMYAYLLLNAMH